MVRFAENAPVIITGDIEGDVNVYRLHGKFFIKLNPNIMHIYYYFNIFLGYEDQNPKD